MQINMFQCEYTLICYALLLCCSNTVCFSVPYYTLICYHIMIYDMLQFRYSIDYNVYHSMMYIEIYGIVLHDMIHIV